MSTSRLGRPDLRRRAPETLADYVVVGICPTLIFFLVGSLMWFLVEVFYQGEFKGRLLWVMAMWVMGIVGIARISMERGREYASLFAAPLGGAVALAMMKFVGDGLVIGSLLMVLVWWAAHKLVWDATLIDDTQDASGEGLLQHMGLEPGLDQVRAEQGGESAQKADAAGSASGGDDRPWWERLLEYDQRPHAPGIWVVYFSLAALPIFGLGGWFVSGSDQVARARTFGLMVIYVASGMGLLLATSFLGLRRYLRQRKLQMPMEMTSTWLVAGVVMICAMLLLATILPRPKREQSLSQLPVVVTSAARRASQIAFGKEGTKDEQTPDAAKTTSPKGEKTSESSPTQEKGRESSSQSGGKRGQTSQGEAKSQGKSGESKGNTAKEGQAKGDGKSDSSAKSGDKAGERSSEANRQGDQNKSGQKTEQQNNDQENQQSGQQQSPPDQQQNQPQDQQPNQGGQTRSPAEILSQAPAAILGSLATAAKWLFYLALLVGCVVGAWMYRAELAAAIAKLVQELSELWAWWFGGKKAEAGESLVPATPPPPPFVSYPDPYLTGTAARMSWPQLVRYTFEALEAWGRERQSSRSDGQTPHEFALAIHAVDAQVGQQAVALAAHYNQLAYAPQSGGGGPKEALRELWKLLGERSASAGR